MSVVSHVDVAPDPRVAGMLKRLAEASRMEDGNVRFDVVQHTMRANHFTVVETWRDQKAFDAHVAAAHTRQYRDELQPMTGSPLDERSTRRSIRPHHRAKDVRDHAKDLVGIVQRARWDHSKGR